MSSHNAFILTRYAQNPSIAKIAQLRDTKYPNAQNPTTAFKQSCHSPTTASIDISQYQDTFQRVHTVRFGLQSPFRTQSTAILGLHNSEGDEKTRYTTHLQDELAKQNKGRVAKAIFNKLNGFNQPGTATVALANHYYKDEKIYTTDLILDVSHTNFYDPQEKKLRIKPGQHVGILLPGVTELDEETGEQVRKVRWFSISTPETGENKSEIEEKEQHPHWPGNHQISYQPNPAIDEPFQGKFLRLIIRRAIPKDDERAEDFVSDYTANLQKGDSVKLIGPVTNRFLGPTSPKTPIVCLGVGTSITPYLAIFRERFENQKNSLGKPADSFLGMGYTDKKLAYDEDRLQQFSADPSNRFTFKPAYSREVGTPSQHIQDIVSQNASQILKILWNPKAHLYISGFRGIEDQIKDTLIHSGKDTVPSQLLTRGLIRFLKLEKHWHVESSSVPAAERTPRVEATV